MPLRCCRWIFFVLFLISVDALPEKLSIAEGLARKHWDIARFATSVLNLMSFCIYLTG